MHGSGCEGEGAGEYRCVAVLHEVIAELRVRQVVGVHPLDLWSHVGAVVWSVACQLQILIADNLLRDVDVGLIWWTGKQRHYWISFRNHNKRNNICKAAFHPEMQLKVKQKNCLFFWFIDYSLMYIPL